MTEWIMNGERVCTSETSPVTLRGAQIKARSRIDPFYKLFLEDPERLLHDAGSREIGEEEMIELRGGESFYTVPPASWGRKPM